MGGCRLREQYRYCFVNDLSGDLEDSASRGRIQFRITQEYFDDTWGSWKKKGISVKSKTGFKLSELRAWFAERSRNSEFSPNGYPRLTAKKDRVKKKFKNSEKNDDDKAISVCSFEMCGLCARGNWCMDVNDVKQIHASNRTHNPINPGSNLGKRVRGDSSSAHPVTFEMRGCVVCMCSYDVLQEAPPHKQSRVGTADDFDTVEFVVHE